MPERWRTAWNPNSFKFSVNLEAGKRVPIKIEWTPNGGVAYCSLRAYNPRDPKEQMQMSWWGEMQDGIDYYFVYGDDMDDVISGYRTLTGKAPIMPKWAMGYWQSREKYNTQEEVLTTLAEFRRRGIPIDNIVIDWLHWKEDSWGSHEFDKARFPDPKGMVDTIHDMNARVMISVWPKFYVTTDHYKEFDEKGWMYKLPVQDSIRDWVGPGYLGSFYDAYDPEARKLFWSQINDHYMPLGIDAWWMDASEPYALRLTPDRTEINADGTDLSYVAVEVVDKDGNLCPWAENEIQFSVEGSGFNAGTDNGSPISLEPFKTDSKKAFYGKALVIVQNNGEKGDIIVKATSPGIKDSNIIINSK